MAQTIIPPGSTLTGLSKQYGSSIEELLKLNPQIKDPNRIVAGAPLVIPDLQPTPQPTPRVTPQPTPQPTPTPQVTPQPTAAPSPTPPVTPPTSPIQPQGPSTAPKVVAPPADLFRVPTAGVGPKGEQIFDVFSDQGHIKDPSDPRLAGVDIGTLPVKKAPAGFESEFGTEEGFQGEEQSDEQQALDFFKQRYGLDFDEGSFKFQPAQSIQDVLTQVMSVFNVPETRASIENISKEVEELETARDKEISEINENPFVSENTRRVQAEKVSEAYEAKLKTRINALKLLEGARTDAREQAKFIASTAINMFTKDRDFYQDRLEDFLDRVENDLELKAKQQEQEAKFSPGTIGEYEFYSQQERSAGRRPISFDAFLTRDANRKARATGSGSRSGGGDKLTLKEAQSLGLPTVLVGRSEASLATDMASPIPSQWFRDLTEQQYQQSIAPQQLQKLWDELRGKFNGATAGGSKLDQLLSSVE